MFPFLEGHFGPLIEIYFKCTLGGNFGRPLEGHFGPLIEIYFKCILGGNFGRPLIEIYFKCILGGNFGRPLMEGLLLSSSHSSNSLVRGSSLL